MVVRNNIFGRGGCNVSILRAVGSFILIRGFRAWLILLALLFGHVHCKLRCCF